MQVVTVDVDVDVMKMWCRCRCRCVVVVDGGSSRLLRDSSSCRMGAGMPGLGVTLSCSTVSDSYSSTQ